MCGSFRTKESVDTTFLAYISPFHFLAPTTTLAPHRHRPRGSPMTCLSTQPLNACFGVVLWMGGIRTERSVPEKIDGFDDCGWRNHLLIVARGGRIVAPQLDPLAPSLTECGCFSGIPRLSHLPVCMKAFEIAWWYRD